MALKAGGGKRSGRQLNYSQSAVSPNSVFRARVDPESVRASRSYRPPDLDRHAPSSSSSTYSSWEISFSPLPPAFPLHLLLPLYSRSSSYPRLPHPPPHRYPPHIPDALPPPSPIHPRPTSHSPPHPPCSLSLLPHRRHRGVDFFAAVRCHVLRCNAL